MEFIFLIGLNEFGQRHGVALVELFALEFQDVVADAFEKRLRQ